MWGPEGRTVWDLCAFPTIMYVINQDTNLYIYTDYFWPRNYNQRTNLVSIELQPTLYLGVASLKVELWVKVLPNEQWIWARVVGFFQGLLPPIYWANDFLIFPKDSLAQIPEWPFKIRTPKPLDRAKIHITHPLSSSFLFTCLSHCRIFWCKVGSLISLTTLSKLHISAKLLEILFGPHSHFNNHSFRYYTFHHGFNHHWGLPSVYL